MPYNVTLEVIVKIDGYQCPPFAVPVRNQSIQDAIDHYANSVNWQVHKGLNAERAKRLAVENELLEAIEEMRKLRKRLRWFGKKDDK